MKKAILACILAIIVLSMYSYAMTCSITDASACTAPNNALIFTISDLADGGSHALPPSEPGAFPKSVCCSGVAGLTATAADTEPASFKQKVGYFAGGHFNRTGSIPPFSTGLWLNAPGALDCIYQKADENCAGYGTCVFSISADNSGYSHVSDCIEHPFNNADNYRYCCRQGAPTCEITDIYWGMFDETTGLPTKMPEPPACPIGINMPVFLFAETSNCEGAVADFTLYDSFPAVYVTPEDLHDTSIPMGTVYFEGSLYDADSPNTIGVYWKNAGEGVAGDYKFKVALTSTEPAFTLSSDYSIGITVSESCRAPNPITPCATTITPEQIDLCTAACSGDPSTCRDADCDGVADCIDEIVITPANCAEVDSCSGGERGTAGCVPAINCLNLPWSECKNCEAGEECNKPVSEGGGDFDAGTMFMERCGTDDPAHNSAGTCACGYIDDVVPTGCNPDPSQPPLNQWDNRFKECIEDEEFPFFDGFNVIAVLVILSMYYGIAIVRKKK